MNYCRVVVTGHEWMGSGFGSIDTAIKTIISEACNELTISAYSIGTGANELLDAIEMALKRTVLVTLIINRPDNLVPNIKRRINKLLRDYAKYLLVYTFIPDVNEELHAKIIISDRIKAIVGSSNLSGRGILTNYELGVCITGNIASEVARAVDLLIQSTKVERLLRIYK